MKEEIAKQMKARKEKGDPIRNPYPFLWEYDEHANFSEMYSVTPMIEDAPSAEIQRLIDGPGPDVSHITRGQTRKMVRTLCEQYCVLDVGGWEQYFPPAEDDLDAAPAQGPVAQEGPVDGGSVTTNEPVEDDLVACDGCEKPMKATDTKCPHCGKTYEVEQAAAIPPPPPTPPLKKRSEAKAAQAAQASLPTPPAPPVGGGIDPSLFAGDGDEIPF